MFADIHSHSRYSFDGHFAPQEMLDSAVSHGVEILTLTDHCEVIGDMKLFFDFVAHEPERKAEILACSASSRLYYGVEIGNPENDSENVASLLKAQDYDLVIGSIHFLADGRDPYYADFSQEKPADVLGGYLNEMLLMAQSQDFDTLAHMDYVLRYIPDAAYPQKDLVPFRDIIHEILKTLVARDKALEFNTASRRKVGRFLFEDWILRDFRSLGGEMVTLGSDAHYTGDVGADFAEAAEILKSAGFDRAVYFDKRQPIFYHL